MIKAPRSFLLIGLVCLLTPPANAGELAASYKEAAAIADAQQQDSSTAGYFSNVLMPYFGQKYAGVLKSCFASVPNPDSSPFSFVVAIGSDGRTLKIFHDGETNILACIRQTIEKDVFPAPPATPFYLHIDMKFTDPPASQDPPPLVLEPGKYSYTFAVPKGWNYDFEQAEQYGVRLVFFPQGGSFDTSNSIVYVSESDAACAATCTGAVSKAIAHEMQQTRQDSPSLHVVLEKPIETLDGGKAQVRILTGLRDSRQPKEALAFIEHRETIVIVCLTTKDPSNWDEDYNVFRQIIAGHKFFTCNSPGLAVSCR